jgi:hypothetical protein
MKDGGDRQVHGGPRHHRFVRSLSVAYLTIQGLGGLAWWTMLLGWPASRSAFLATGAPDATLLAFAAADLLLFAGGSLVAAWGLATRQRWGWPVLCLHTGAAVYAGLYCLMLGLLDRRAWLGAVMMLPPLIVPALIAWYSRPRESRGC